jgi:hypothetical protein
LLPLLKRLLLAVVWVERVVSVAAKVVVVARKIGLLQQRETKQKSRVGSGE